MGQQGISKKPSVLRAFAVWAFAAVLVLVLFKILFSGKPSDGRLVREFQKHRAAFVELKAMIATNSPTGNPNAATTVWSTQDYHKYLKLTQKAGVNQAYVEGEEYHFQVIGPETACKADCRVAIVWRESAPDRVIPNLDKFRKTSPQPEYAYRALAEGWYLWITK